MKRWLFLVGFCWLALTAAAQTQPLLRYWTDGNYASRADKVISLGDWQSAVDMRQLSPGVHIICMQMRDTSGQWTAPRSFLFVKTPAPEDTLPTVYSYWFDGDYASCVSGRYAYGTPMQFNTDGLSDGPHKLYVRLGDGLQSQVRSYLYLKVTAVEDTLPTVYSYWFDGDYASRVSGQYAYGTPMQFNTDGLSEGPHKLYVRLGDGLQSQVRSYLYLKVTEVEDTLPTVYSYWIDGDFASRVSGQFVYGKSLMFNTDGLSEGVHKLYVRLGDGLQSQLRSYIYLKVTEVEDTLPTVYSYWIDGDFASRVSGQFGYGNSLQFNMSNLSEGIHRLYVRLGDGLQSQLRSFLFVKPEEEDTMELVFNYCFDSTFVLASGKIKSGKAVCNAEDLDTAGSHWLCLRLGSGTVTQLGAYPFVVTPIYYKLTVESEDTLKGTAAGSGTYLRRDTAILTATARPGYHFAAWKDGDTTNPRLVTVLGDSSFTATFAPNSYRLSVVSADTVKGMVSGDGRYTYLSQVKISATPKYGYHFTAWSDGDTTSPRVVTVLGDSSFTATFAPNSYRLSVVSADTVKGMVSGDGRYTYLSQVKISATPKYGYHFAAWKDGDTTNPRVVTVLGDSSFIAVFAPNSYRLAVSSNDTAMGMVEGGGSYDYGDTVLLKAVAAAHHHFLYWSDGDTTNPRSVTVNCDSSFTAIFAIDTHMVSLLSNDTAMGRVKGEGLYAYGTEVELVAVAAANHHFVRWSDGDTANPRRITVMGDTTLTAFFEYNTGVQEYTLPDGISVYGSDMHIVIRGAEGHEATVFGVAGQLLHAAILNGDIVKIPMPVKGVYFIRIGRYPVQKVLVY